MTKEKLLETKAKSYQFNHQKIQGWNDCPTSLCSGPKVSRKPRRPKRINSYVSFLDPSTKNDVLNTHAGHFPNSKLNATLPPPPPKMKFPDAGHLDSQTITKQSSERDRKSISNELAQIFTLRSKLTEQELLKFRKQIDESNLSYNEASKQTALSLINDFKQHADITKIGGQILEFRQRHSDASWCLPLWKVLQSAEAES